jgi:hypothetical protein
VRLSVVCAPFSDRPCELPKTHVVCSTQSLPLGPSRRPSSVYGTRASPATMERLRAPREHIHNGSPRATPSAPRRGSREGYVGRSQSRDAIAPRSERAVDSAGARELLDHNALPAPGAGHAPVAHLFPARPADAAESRRRGPVLRVGDAAGGPEPAGTQGDRARGDRAAGLAAFMYRRSRRDTRVNVASGRDQFSMLRPRDLRAAPPEASF